MLGAMGVAAGAMWVIFWLTIGRTMNNPDFAASVPAHHAAAGASSPTFYLVLIGWYVTFVVLAGALPGLVAGLALKQRRPWARRFAIVVSVLDILLIEPLHLFLGIYGLVILTQETALLAIATPEPLTPPLRPQ